MSKERKSNKEAKKPKKDPKDKKEKKEPNKQTRANVTIRSPPLYSRLDLTAFAPMQEVTDLRFIDAITIYGSPDYFFSEYFRVIFDVATGIGLVAKAFCYIYYKYLLILLVFSIKVYLWFEKLHRDNQRATPQKPSRCSAFTKTKCRDPTVDYSESV